MHHMHHSERIYWDNLRCLIATLSRRSELFHSDEPRAANWLYALPMRSVWLLIKHRTFNPVLLSFGAIGWLLLGMARIADRHRLRFIAISNRGVLEDPSLQSEDPSQRQTSATIASPTKTGSDGRLLMLWRSVRPVQSCADSVPMVCESEDSALL